MSLFNLMTEVSHVRSCFKLLWRYNHFLDLNIGLKYRMTVSINYLHFSYGIYDDHKTIYI